MRSMRTLSVGTSMPPAISSNSPKPKNTPDGKPGTSDIAKQMPPATSNTRGIDDNCFCIESPRCLSL